MMSVEQNSLSLESDRELSSGFYAILGTGCIVLISIHSMILKRAELESTWWRGKAAFTGDM